MVLEESFDNTLRFVERLAPEAVIIIPHLGGLNGGYQALDRAGVWQRDNVYADTALASPQEMRHFLEHYGPHKLLFGSDYPFGLPAGELRKIERLDLDPADFEQVVAGMHNRDIAASLGISVRTVEVHKARMMGKLGTQSIADLVRMNLQEMPADTN